MAGKYCPACLGSGSYLGTEWVRDDSSPTRIKRVTLRKPCEMCAVRNVEPQVAKDLWDGVYGWMLAAALFGYSGFQLFQDQSGPQEWLRVAVAMLATLFVGVIFSDSVGHARIHRWTTLLLVISAMLTDVTLEVAR